MSELDGCVNRRQRIPILIMGIFSLDAKLVEKGYIIPCLELVNRDCPLFA